MAMAIAIPSAFARIRPNKRKIRGRLAAIRALSGWWILPMASAGACGWIGGSAALSGVW